MTTRERIMIASIAVFIGSIALAGTGFTADDGTSRRGGRLLNTAVEKIDRDNDGKITQDEIDASRRERFGKLDANQDGSLTLEEFQALARHDRMRDRLADRFQTMDNNGDSVLTSEEFMAPISDIVNKRDRDGDGALTRDEIRQ